MAPEPLFVYNWLWELSDPDEPDFPKGHATRFKNTVYHEGND